jgi:hypothetical protein
MIRLKDALQERGLVDRWGFVGFAVVGGLLIWGLKEWTQVPVEVIAFGAAALMGTYAWIVSSRGTGKLRSDQAGDNCYYLGLIYTLISLSHAIFTFDPADTATTIVQGFGIALLTTIFGLVLRVFFNQSRVDLQEIEDTARLELAEAAGRLKTQLAQVANSFRDFGFGLQQSLEELRASATTSISSAADESVKAIRELAQTTGEGLQSQTTSLKDRVAELTKATSRTVTALDKHAGSLEGLTEQQVASAESLRVIESAVAATAQGSEQIRAQIESAASSQAMITSAATEFTGTVGRLQTSVSDSLETLTALQTNFQDRLKELERAPQTTMDAAMKAVAAAAERLSAMIDKLAAQHEGAGRSMEEVSSGVVRSLQSHNAEIEAELGRSRENAAKVHGALVDLTTELAERVERRAGA